MKKIKNKLFTPAKRVKSFISSSSRHKYVGDYYALAEDFNGMVLISENNTIGTMCLAQNWMSHKDDVVFA